MTLDFIKWWGSSSGSLGNNRVILSISLLPDPFWSYLRVKSIFFKIVRIRILDKRRSWCNCVVRPKLTLHHGLFQHYLKCEITLSVRRIRSTSSTTTNIGHHQIVSSAYPYTILCNFGWYSFLTSNSCSVFSFRGTNFGSTSNCYCRKKWTQWPEFKSWTRQFTFHKELITLGKVCMQ